MLKPLGQLSPVYRKRIESALARGLTRSQGRGHAKPVELPARDVRVLSRGGSGVVARSAARPNFAVLPSSRTIDTPKAHIVFTDIQMRNVSGDWEKELDRFLKSPAGNHKLYRLIAQIGFYDIEQLGFKASNLHYTTDKNGNQIVYEIISTPYETRKGRTNFDRIKALDGYVLSLTIEFKDTVKRRVL